ncbi:MAG: Ada metal-binding domain-containing protein [Burkholderiaceae bacterium]|nr:Ada metal-binding domain-containing protein [Burkholderiaceae bacterium]
MTPLSVPPLRSEVAITGAADSVYYQALKAHDARFDGHFFVGVSSTRIYCRPVCRVKLPKFENCRFFNHAALAESAGYRPCLRCRPELAPSRLPWTTLDASRTLALQAARWLDEPLAWHGQGADPPDTKPTISQLAAHLGVSDRHVRRLFEAQFGVSPLQYLQTRRLLTAKQLLTDTDMPIAQVALSSGFGSVRRFSAAFLEHYRLNPTQLRRSVKLVNGSPARPAAPSFCVVKLGYRPPYDSRWMLEFFRKRQVNAIEYVAIEANKLSAGWTLRLESGGKQVRGWVVAEFLPAQPTVLLQVSDSLRDVLPQVIRQVRALLDLDADPLAINAVLGRCFMPAQPLHPDLERPGPSYEGIRVPGCLNGFELAVRAILGQQVTVAAGRTFTQRVVDALGSPIETPFPLLTRLFPTPEALAQASGEELGRLGIVKQRQTAMVALARAVADKQLHLHPSADVNATMTALRALPGVGDWTAQYIAMRALRWPDAFVAGDVALHKAMGLQHLNPPLSPAKTAAAALAASQVWRPWRSYAVMRAWTSLS